MKTSWLIKSIVPKLLATVSAFFCAAFIDNLAFAGRIIFAEPEPIRIGPLPAGPVESGDFDGDGDMDFLVGFLTDDTILDTIAWLENDGDHRSPSFAYHTIPFGISQSVTSFVVEDLDGDGDLDFAVGTASFLGGMALWYENEGGVALSFRPHELENFFMRTHSMISADLDGDGDPDLASCHLFFDRISWYENDPADPDRFILHVITDDPDGTFGPLEGFADGVAGLSAGDIDGDGDIDLVSASESNDTIAWYENDGVSNPSFIPRIIGIRADRPRKVVAADMDGDGDLDVVASSINDDKIAWHENGGGSPPVWTEHVIVEDPDGPSGPLNGFVDQPRGIVAEDLDRDGDMDLVSSSSGDSRIAWYENLGLPGPSFLPRSITISPLIPGRVLVIDFDSDGDRDLVFASQVLFNTVSPQVSWIENKATLPHGKGGRHWKMLATR